ncbi:MAG TPA: deoxyribonuclease IV [Solirubrobacteraceae bacterium]|nr:deoxyribonuclease IV [Solirubrobacteraceae bacterium]
MLIGAHVSQAGGLPKAVERGVELGCEAIQIFNQSPRMWRPTAYTDDDFAAFRAAMDDSPIEAVLIHAVYLLNCGSDDPEIRERSLASLIQSLRVGAGIGAAGVVLHPGSAKTGHVGEAIARAGEVIAEALAETDSCALHLEDTAGAGGTLGRSFEELAALIDAAGGDSRLGVCLDSCHLLCSGYDVRTAAGLAETIDRFDEVVGLERLGSLHLNDSVNPLGSNRDRHADIGEGELGDTGCAAFLAEPRFERLPCVLETPGPDKKGPTKEEVAHCFELRRRGSGARKGGRRAAAQTGERRAAAQQAGRTSQRAAR